MTTPAIALEGVSKTYADETVVRDVSLTVEEGVLLVLLGRSGSGKSTTLRMINRLIEPSRGRVLIDGHDVMSIEPVESLRRCIGYAIQSGGLFPHWTVARNVATVPTLLGWPRARIDARTDELLALLDLPPARYRDRRPAQLSGGEQQRVGIARALAADPPILLMDEPFGALDPVTRGPLQQAFRRIQREQNKTVVFVTHDIDEALILADRIAVMDAGALVQHATPAELFASPASPFVASLIGGSEPGLRRLAVTPVSARTRPGDGTGGISGEPIDPDASLREALALMLARGTDRLAVVGGGELRLADLVAPEGAP